MFTLAMRIIYTLIGQVLAPVPRVAHLSDRDGNWPSMQPDTKYAKSGDVRVAYQVTGGYRGLMRLILIENARPACEPSTGGRDIGS